ncbi:hypothetical protein FQN60_009107, partial [Etheostoma spectabile]
MIMTFIYWQAMFNDEAKSSDVFLVFPRFLDTSGLIEQDFRLLFGEAMANKFLEKWPTTFKEKVLKESHGLVPTTELLDWMCIAESAAEVENGLDSDMSAILLLLHLLPPSAQGRKRPGKMSACQAVDQLIRFQKVGTSVQQHLINITQSSQPYLHALGSTLSGIHSYFMVVDKHALPCKATGSVGAFDKPITHPLFSMEKQTIQVQMFSDDYELANPWVLSEHLTSPSCDCGAAGFGKGVKPYVSASMSPPSLPHESCFTHCQMNSSQTVNMLSAMSAIVPPQQADDSLSFRLVVPPIKQGNLDVKCIAFLSSSTLLLSLSPTAVVEEFLSCIFPAKLNASLPGFPPLSVPATAISPQCPSICPHSSSQLHFTRSPISPCLLSFHHPFLSPIVSSPPFLSFCLTLAAFSTISAHRDWSAKGKKDGKRGVDREMREEKREREILPVGLISTQLIGLYSILPSTASFTLRSSA